MATVVEQVKALGLPDDEYVVIGSGILDALQLRTSSDVDFAVSESLFAKLQQSGDYQQEVRYGQDVLIGAELEFWRDWKADLPFETLLASAVVIDGVRFAAPEVVIMRKRERGWDKDVRDITLLEEYYRGK